MTPRLRIAAGNWKMNTSVTEGYALAESLARSWHGEEAKRMVLAPPYTHLMAVQSALDGSDIGLAAQNCHWEEKGAFTGEISPRILADMGLDYVILGHSERREIFAESNEIIRRKVDRSIAFGLKVIFCCGEPLATREMGSQNAFVETQLKESLLHLTVDQLSAIVIAYEPIWAIGTGVTATSAQAQEMHAFIRTILAQNYSSEYAEAMTILYGGSVKASNASELFGQPDVDGGLVGGASLSADEFLQIGAAL